MSLPFTPNEIKILIEFLNNNFDDAILISEKCLTSLSTDELFLSFELPISIPPLKSYLTIDDNFLVIIHKPAIRDFFISFKILYEHRDINKSIDTYWDLRRNTNIKAKPENFDEYIILLSDKYFKIALNTAFQEKNWKFHSLLFGFGNVLHYLNLSATEIYAILTQIEITLNGDPSSIWTHLYDFPKHKIEASEELFNLISGNKHNALIKHIYHLGKGLSEVKETKGILQRGLELTQSESIEEQKAGLLLIGGLNYSSEEEKTTAFETLKNFSGQSSNTNYEAVQGLLELSKITDIANDQILKLSTIPDNVYSYYIGQFIWLNNKNSSRKEWFEKAALNLTEHPTENGQVIQSLIFFINDLFRSNKEIEAIVLLENWIKNGQNVESLELCISELARDNFDYFKRMITEWFLSSNSNLLNALLKITGHEYGMQIRFDIKLLDGYSEYQISKIISATIGFVYSKEALASLLISILDSKHCRNFANEICDILSNYICYTYPSTMDNFVKPELNSSKGLKRKTLKCVVNNIDGYFDSIRKLPFLIELSGSDKRKENFHKAFEKKQNEIMDEIGQKSIWSQISKTVLLRTGPIWFSKYEGQYTKESRMGSIESSIEMPRAEFIDPTYFEFYRNRMRYQALMK